ncbi:MAG: polyprenol monophosphomannose synthase [Bacteroidota bacterium]
MADALVIIPTYNERENIENVSRAVMSLPQPFELLVVDDNSSDGTADIVRNLMQEYPDRIHLEVRAGKLGLGTAYIHGFRWALSKGYDYVFEMDADMSHNPADLVRLYKSCKDDGNDLAIGSRYIKGVNVVNWPIGRVIMSYYASVYVRMVTGMPVKDATAGFKCYRRRVLESIELERIRFMGYAFQIEMKFTAWKLGFKLKEVPIIFTDRQEGVSKMSTRIFREAFFGVIQMKVGSWFRKYQPKNGSR